MKGILATLAAAATTLGLAAPADAVPADPMDLVYVAYLSNHGVHVPDGMTQAAGQFARQICTYATEGMTLAEIDALVHVHFDNVGPVQTLAIEQGAAQFYCSPRSNLQ